MGFCVKNRIFEGAQISKIPHFSRPYGILREKTDKNQIFEGAKISKIPHFSRPYGILERKQTKNRRNSTLRDVRKTQKTAKMPMYRQECPRVLSRAGERQEKVIGDTRTLYSGDPIILV